MAMCAERSNDEPLLDMLRGGARRSIGRVEELLAAVRQTPDRFAELMAGIEADDPVVRMRAADAVEKLTADHPEWLASYRARLLGELAEIDQQEVRWHLAQLMPRLDLDRSEEDRAVDTLEGFLSDSSAIVRTFSMQALADLALRSPRLIPRVRTHIAELTRTGTPALQARGRKLLQALDEKDRR